MPKPETTITTEVECTWPADDITICQEITKDGKQHRISFISLDIAEVDQFITDLIAAKAKAEEWNKSVRQYEATQRKLEAAK